MSEKVRIHLEQRSTLQYKGRRKARVNCIHVHSLSKRANLSNAPVMRRFCFLNRASLAGLVVCFTSFINQDLN